MSPWKALWIRKRTRTRPIFAQTAFPGFSPLIIVSRCKSLDLALFGMQIKGRKLFLPLFARDFSGCYAGCAPPIVGGAEVVRIIRAIRFAAACHWFSNNAKDPCRSTLTSGESKSVAIVKTAGKFGVHEFIHSFFVDSF